MLKHKVNKDFTVITNKIFRDKTLSIKAKGLWVQLVSLPEGWNFTIAGLAELSNDGRDSIRSGLAELVEHGWLEWDQKNEDGQFGGNEVTTKIPLTENPTTDSAHNKELNNKERNNKPTKVGLSASRRTVNNFGNNKVDGVVNYWKKTVGLPLRNIKKQRFAASTLIRRFNYKEAIALIDIVSVAHKDKFSGKASCSDLIELEQNANTVMVYAKKQQSNQGGINVGF